MPRLTTKKDLIKLANLQWEKMWELIDSMPIEQRKSSFNFPDDPKLKEAHWKRDNNLRDILIHLYEWHRLLLDWVSANKNGNNMPFLPKPYTWKTYGDMNVEFFIKHQSTPYEDAVSILNNSHFAVMKLIESLSEEELFEKKYYSWTGTSNIGSYCISVTSSHYDWAIKKIKLHIKTYTK